MSCARPKSGTRSTQHFCRMVYIPKVERSKVVRTCIYVALTCYFLNKVMESINKFRHRKISVAEEEVPIIVNYSLPMCGSSDKSDKHTIFTAIQ